MSYILDALKKLEKEKARARKEVDPVKQLVIPDYSTSGIPGGRPVWPKVAIGLAVGVFLIGVTYWTTRHVFLPHPQAPMIRGKVAPQVTKEVTQAPATVPGKQVEEESPARSPTVTTIPPADTVLFGNRETVPQIQISEGVGKEDRGATSLPETALPKSEYRLRESQPSDAIEQPLSLRDNESGTSQSFDMDLGSKAGRTGTEGQRYASMRPPSGAPGLKISAIVWSSDALKRFAIVNLRGVHEGDSIEGALVSEIQSDGIVFKWQGSEYKILMSRH